METARAHLVSKEDVGHGTASASRNDGYARRSKLRVASSNAGGSMRKANNGEVEGEDEDGTNEDEDQTEEDADATENEDYGMSGKSVLSRQDSNVSGQTDMSIDSPSTSRAGLRVAGSSSMKRKRTTSELSTGTILSTIEQDNDEDEVVYPRKRMDRRLSNENGLLRYDQRVVEVDEDIDVAEYSKAIESSSEDEAVVLDDDSTDDEATNADEALDDLDIEEEEEALILEEEELRDFTGTAASSVVGADSDIELPSDLDLGFLNSEMDDVFDAGESFFFRGMHSDQETPRRKKSDASARRVRFQDEIDIAQANTYSASTTSSETDIDIFPDLLDNPFKSQDELPANLRSQIEDEEDAEVGNGASSDGEGSVWDFGEEKASENFFAWHDEAGSDSDDSGSDLSGYDCMHHQMYLPFLVMLTQITQLMVTLPMMTSLLQALSEHQNPFCTAARRPLSPPKSPHRSHFHGTADAVVAQSWAHSLLMRRRPWPLSIQTPSSSESSLHASHTPTHSIAPQAVSTIRLRSISMV